jgi:predicted dehydrogenase
MARKTRWAVAGTGGITARTLPDLALTENVEVVAVSSRTQPRADTFASEFGIPRAYRAYQAMLADPDVNVVYICTPHGAHFAMTAQAIQAGKHVLCEKPFTVNAAQARLLASLAREHDVFLMEAMWTKFNPTVRQLRETVGAGTIGAVRHITAAMGFPVPAASSRFWSAEQGGGALLDLGVYVITFAEMFLAEAGDVTVSSVLGRIREDGVDIRALVTLAAGEATAQLATSIDHTVVPAASIAGTSGFILVDMPFWVPKGFDVYPGGLGPGAPPPIRVETDPEGTGYVPMFRAVSEAVQSGWTEHPAHSLSATIGTLELVDEVRRQLLDTHYPARGALEPWDSIPELPVDVRN